MIAIEAEPIIEEGERTGGAWFTNDVTRMDDQQHALSALLNAASILDERKKP